MKYYESATSKLN